MGTDVNAAKKLEGELTPEEQIKNLEGEVETRQQEITRLTESVEGTKAKLNEAREKLGFPPTEEEPPSVFSEKEKLEKLKAEQETLEKQKEELISQQEKERMIHEEKEKILQEKIDELRTKIEIKDNEQDLIRAFEYSSTNGREIYGEGRRVEETFLETDPSKSVLIFFKEGKIDKIIAGPEANVDEIIETLTKDENFEADLTQKAEQRVGERLEEEKKKIEEEQKKGKKPAEQKPEEKPETPKGEVSAEELKQGQNVVEGGNIENPKA